MKKIILIIISLFIYMIPVNAEWNDNMTGSGVEISYGIGCTKPSIGSCYTFCNNMTYLAFRAQLVYYDGSRYNILGSGTFGEAVGGQFDGAWFVDYIPGMKHWPLIPDNLNGDSAGYSSSMKTTILSNIESLLNEMGVNNNTLINDIKDGKYPKHQKMGSNGVNTTGVRIILEPIFTYSSTGACPGVGSGMNLSGTYKAIAEYAYNKSEASKPYLWERAMRSFGNVVRLEKSDIGYTKMEGEGNWSQWSDKKSGFGIGIFSPYDEIAAGDSGKCDPDKDENAVKSCCDQFGITSSNKSGNTTENLTRLLTDREIESECGGSTPAAPAEACNYTLKDTTIENCGEESYHDGFDSGNFISSKFNSWPCIFKSPESNYEEVKNHFDDMGSDQNDYCHIYCNETVRYKFPEPGISTYSGRYLVVGESNIHAALAPVKYSVERECRTTDKANSTKGEINYEQFLRDMEANEALIVQAWDNYRTWQTKQQACDNAPYLGQETHMHCSRYGDVDANQCIEYNYFWHSNYGIGRASYDGVEQTCEYKVGHCYFKPDYSYQISSAYNTYNNLINKRNEMLGQIEKCNSHTTTAVIDPKIKFEYEEPVYGSEVDLVETESNETLQTEYFKGSDATKSQEETEAYKSYVSETEKVNVADCKEDNCRDTREVTYMSNKWVKYNYIKSKTFGLPENMYLYVNKYSGQSFNTQAEAGAEHITMDRSNLPIHFSTKPGDYDFKLETSTFGSGNRLEDFAFNGATFGGNEYNYEKEYNCTYNVSCKKMVMKKEEDCEHFKTQCPTEYAKFGCGSGFMFRPISLNSKQEAFPGQDGNGRTPGGQWNNDTTINAVILNGREVDGYDIYKQDPMYEIILTPGLMRDIKDYNKNMNSELVTIYEEDLPTTGVAGYTSLKNVECIYNGGHCISEKIRDWGVKGCALINRDSGYDKCIDVQPW